MIRPKQWHIPKFRYIMNQWTKKCFHLLVFLLVFAIPIEHKYDKFLRYFSKSLLPPHLSLPMGFDKKIYFYPSDILAPLLCLSLLFAFRTPLQRLLFTKGTPYLWLLFFLATISIVLSPLAAYPVIYTRLFQLLTPILLFACFSHAPAPEKTARYAFYALVMAATCQSLLAIAQYFTQAPLGLRLLNEPHYATGTFFMFDGSRWLLDLFFHSPHPAHIWRSSG